jgi:multidrug resistance protein MdtO
MPAQTVSFPLPARMVSERIPLLHFLRTELAPFPGRAIATFRVVVACSVVLVLCMTLRIPEPHLAVWVVTRVAMEESSESLLTGLVFLIALTIGVAIPLVLFTFAMDQAWLRFCLMAAMAGLGLFLRQTFVIGALGFVIGLIGAVLMTAPDFIPIPELVVRGSLWLWPVFALGITAAVAANLLISPTDPETLLCEELAARLRSTEDAIARHLGGRSEESGAKRLARAGVARLLLLLKSAEVAHPSLKVRHPQQSALITLVDRLVTSAAALELLSRTVPDADERTRLQRVAESCAGVRRALENGRTPERVQPVEWPPHRGGGSAVFPVLVELEHVVDLMQQALGPEGAAAEVASSEPGHLFVPDAFTNPNYIRYALKGALAVMICYTLQSAVDWPGIRTCLITCLIVGLGSEGATIQKGTLRISGALVGAAMGFLSILLFIPGMESITSLTLLVAAGTAVAAWVVLGSPRIAYAGVQIAFAFYVCVIQGFEPTWHFYTIRDRLIGILLGNTVITLVFHYIWPMPASGAMWTSLGSALRSMARLATVGTRGDAQAPAASAAEGLRLQASHDFTIAQQLADQAAFELGAPSREGLAARERLQRAAADAQSVFLTQLAIAHPPRDVVPALPGALGAGVRRFDAAVAESLEAIGALADGSAQRPIPDLRVQLAAVTAITKGGVPGITSREVAGHVESRLALYRELVPRIERLGADFAE